MLRGRWTIGNRTIAAIGLIVTLLGVALTMHRITTQYQTPGPFDHDAQGLCDFHNGIYFPARAVIAGESPYGQRYADTYPVARQIPFFSPIILVLHAPLAALPLRVAESLHVCMQVAMLFGIATLAAAAAGLPRRVDAVAAIAAWMIFSRGGHITLFNGYFTFLLVLATYLSLWWADRYPIRSAVTLAIVSAKPTYILPLGFLMLARGHYRALTLGAVLSVVGALGPLAWIAHRQGDGDFIAGAETLRDQIIHTQEVHRAMPDESPVHSWTRLDLFAIISKWRGEDPGDTAHLAVMFIIMAVPMVVLWRRHGCEPCDCLAGLSGTVILTTLLVSLYHQSYDSLLMAAPVAAILAGRLPAWRCRPLAVRLLLAGLLVFPALNYLSTRTALLCLEPDGVMVKMFTSLNGLLLTAGLGMLIVLAIRDRNVDGADATKRNDGTTADDAG